jgi:hypothetical protein
MLTSATDETVNLGQQQDSKIKTRHVRVTLMPSQQMQLLCFQKKIIGGKRTSCPWHEHRWPLSPSFKGQTSRQKVTIIMI